MKKTLFAVMASLLAYSAMAQTTVDYKYGSTKAVDAALMTTSGCQPNSPIINAANTPNGTDVEDDYMAWTFNAEGCNLGTIRSLIRFDALNNIPPCATIIQATLYLYGIPSSSNYGNSSYPGSPYNGYGTNIGHVSEVDNTPAGAWSDATVTWNTQPSLLGSMPVTPIPISTAQWSDNSGGLDVTAMVQDMIANTNNGFMISLDTEVYYRGRLFASSDNADSTLWPELVVTYRPCCNSNFNYCFNTTNPQQVSFTANDPTQAATYKWDFGDGNGAVGTSVTHTYAPGSYTACLTIIGNGLQCRTCIDFCVSKQVQGKYANSNTENVAQLTPLAINKIYPNPTSSDLNIELTAQNGKAAHFKVYDVSGRLVSDVVKQLNVGDGKYTISTGKLVNGTYFLEITDGQSVVRQPFLKN